MPERGIVTKVARDKSGNAIGFAELADHRQVFFHVTGASSPKITQLSKTSPPYVTYGHAACRFPLVGDELLMNVSPSRRGLKALVWSLAQEWAETERLIEYRVSEVREIRTHDAIRSVENRLWWGYDIDELKRLYPDGCPELQRRQEGQTRVEVKFEVSWPGHDWSECPDPRKSLLSSV